MNSNSMKQMRFHPGLTLMIFIFSSVFAVNSSAQKYTADFTSAPDFTAYPGVPSWLMTAEVTLGNTPYTIVNAGNGGWAHRTTGGNANGANLLYNTAATTYVTIQRKDNQRFKFYGVWLKYTNYISQYYLPPYLRVTYNGATVNGVAVPDEVFDANTQVTLNKDLNVTSVTLNFSGLSNLNFDDLIVGPAIVGTSTVNQFSATSALLGGTVAADAAGVTERGYVYNTTGSPTTSDTKIQCGSGTGLYSQAATGLGNSTIYYVRAYAINSFGTAYGNQETFTTAGPFTLAGTHYFNTSWLSTTGQASPFTKYIEGWDITGVSSGSGLISVSRLTSTLAAEGLASVRILSSTLTENVNVVKVKPNNGSAFDLQSFKFRYGTRVTGTSFGTIKITGFKNGSPVSGAQTTRTGIGPYSSSSAYTTIDLSGNTSFGNIDEFMIETADPVNAARWYYTDIDVLTVREVTNVLSSNADLSNLSVSAGSLSPGFSPAASGYSVAVANATSAISISPSVSDAAATVRVNGSVVSTGGAVTVPLNEGSNTISIVVTAQDGVTSETYTITVNRAAKAMVTSIVRSGASVSNALVVNYNVSFDQAVSGLSAANFSITPASISGAEISTVTAVSATQYTVSVNTGSGDGTLFLTMANAASVIPNVGNLPYISEYFTIDKTSPVIAGVENDQIYNTNKTISFNEGTATLNGAPFTNGSMVSAAGTYVVSVTDATGNNTTVNFTITSSITVTEIPASNCANDYVTVSYSATRTFDQGNVFSIELSDATGNFASPVVIGSYAGTATGSFVGHIPSHLPDGNNYRLRISSTNPAVTGVAGTPVTIHDRPNAPVIEGQNSADVNIFYNYSTSPEAGSTWQWISPAIADHFENTSKMEWSSAANNQVIQVIKTNQYGCTGDTGSISVNVYDISITGVTVSTLNPCPGSDITVTAKVSGAFNRDENEFIAQLSNPDGTFIKPKTIGRLSAKPVGINNEISFTATIPVLIANGSGYRIRVVASSPRFNGVDNGADIQISKPQLGADKVVGKCMGSAADLTAVFNTAGLTGEWSTTTPASVTTPGIYILIATNVTGCKDTANVEVKDYAKPELGSDTTIKTSGSSIDLTMLYNTAAYSAKWNTSLPTAAPAGRYRLIASNNGCKDTVSVKVITTNATLARGANGLELSAEGKTLLTDGKLNAVLFPNPAKAASTLQVSGSSKGYTVTISDLAGKQFWSSKNIIVPSLSLPIERLARGLYNVTVNSGNDIKTLRLIKE